MVYRPQDPCSPQLYVVKREFKEEYESGYHSSVGPKLYKLSNAKSVANKNNKYEEYAHKPGYDPASHYDTEYLKTHYTPEQLDELIKQARKSHKELLKKGKWIVVPAMISTP